MPRDVAGWLPAVVLELGEKTARIGIEGVSDDEDGHWIPAEDVTWAKKRLADGKLGPKAKVAGDLVSVFGRVGRWYEVTCMEGRCTRPLWGPAYPSGWVHRDYVRARGVCP